MQKFLGDRLLPVYLVCGLIVLAVVSSPPALERISRIPARTAWAIAAVGGAVLLTGFLVAYPIVNQGTAGGSDRDEALNLAVGALLSGNYPYYERTYLGNPISPMPGSLLLAVPFFLIGNSSLQNMFWLACFSFLASRLLASSAHALALMAVILAISPIVLHEFVTGGDMLANSLFVACLILLGVTAIRSGWGSGRCVASMALLGIGLSSRANFLFTLPLLLAWMVHAAGLRRGLIYGGIALASFAAVTLPFWLLDPAGFSPLHTAGKLTAFDSWLPGTGAAVLTLMVSMSVLLAWRYAHCSVSALLVTCAAVQAVPILVFALLSSVKSGRADLIGIGSGLSFLFVGALGTWAASLSEQDAYARRQLEPV